MESRIHGDVYVRFGGEFLETYHRNMERRWVLSLHAGKTQSSPLPDQQENSPQAFQKFQKKKSVE